MATIFGTKFCPYYRIIRYYNKIVADTYNSYYRLELLAYIYNSTHHRKWWSDIAPFDCRSFYLQEYIKPLTSYSTFGLFLTICAKRYTIHKALPSVMEELLKIAHLTATECDIAIKNIIDSDFIGSDIAIKKLRVRYYK